MIKSKLRTTMVWPTEMTFPKTMYFTYDDTRYGLLEKHSTFNAIRTGALINQLKEEEIKNWYAD
jgi:hypothetical protein